MKFINRALELEFLENKHGSDQAELIVLYGRRRIGKTELITHFLKDKKSMYFLGRLESREDTIKRINHLLASHFRDFDVVARPLSDWDQVFDYIAVKSKTEKTVFVFDEFPFLVDKFPELPSVLQDKWDSTLKASKVMLFLSGSSVGMMEKHALSYKSPLYGRRTGQWFLRKLEPKYLASFFPDYSVEDLLLVYSSLDTIPGYLVQFNRNINVWENIKSRVLSKGEFLYEEVEILLREELRDPSNYMSILASIAGGLTTFSEIHSQTGLDRSMLSKYLSVLEKLAIVGKSVPVTEGYKKKLKARGALYSLKDNFFDFWFRFVYPNFSQLETGQTREVLSSIRRDVNPFLGRKFEAFIAESFHLFFPNLPVVGRWWQKGEEIDVVALNDKTGEILFCECKWQNNVDGSRLLRNLKEKAEHVSWRERGRVEHYCIFAKSFSRLPEDCLSFGLKDIEKILHKNNA